MDAIRDAAARYLNDELGRSEVVVADVLERDGEALVLCRAKLGDFALHLNNALGHWAVVDELDAEDFYRNR